MTIPPDYTPHDGGPCPVGDKAVVETLTESGAKTLRYAREIVWPWDAFIYEIWETIPKSARIIAYKVITPDPADAMADALEKIAAAPMSIDGGSIASCRRIATEALKQYRDSRNG